MPCKPAKIASERVTSPSIRRTSLPPPPTSETPPPIVRELRKLASEISMVSLNLPPITVRIPAPAARDPSSMSLAELLVLKTWILETLPKSSSANEVCPALEMERLLVPCPPSMVNMPNSET
jgi:hypothetical protein